MTTALEARRLLLTSDELAVLVDRSGVTLPLSLTPIGEPPTDAGRLYELGVLTEDGAPAPSMAIDAAVLSAAEVRLTTDVDVGDVALTALHALRGAQGVGVVRADPRGVEWSAFLSGNIGAELIRCVPPLARGAGQRAPVRVRDVRELLDAQAQGALTIQVAALDAAGQVVGTVITWVVLDGAWWTLAPSRDADGTAWVTPTPVDRTQLTAEVAAAIAGVLA